MTAPTARATRRFAAFLFTAIAIYGLWAIFLSIHTIVQQAPVRRHLWLALETLRQLPPDATADAAAAQRSARLLVAHWNRIHPHNPCGPGPAYVLAQDLPAQHACLVSVGVQGNHLRVRAYDTQGYAMDNIYEALYPPPPPKVE
ncbi:hypothetical protein [Acidithiobacillus sp.]|uniref:hypothetical protein n=1 Tax=Acidithiobacillus sp. TaxID=1872118 RepID=UPI003CFCC6CE